MRAVLAGIGVREALGSVGAGTVTASFSKACYLDVAGTTVALVAPEVHPGPLHLLLDASPPRPRVGAPVTVDDSRVVVDGRAIELLGAAPWDGALPPDERVRARSATIARVAAAAATRSALRTEPFAGPAAIARDLVERGLLDDAARILAGLGPGFTPSGDDALAGVALGLRAALGPAAAPAAARAAAGAAGFGRSAIAWAARGHALSPIHDLLAAVVADDDGAARAAATAMASIGETSGSDLLEGLGWVLGGDAVYAFAAVEGLEPAATSSR